jgi:hypothetical protein
MKFSPVLLHQARNSSNKGSWYGDVWAIRQTNRLNNIIILLKMHSRHVTLQKMHSAFATSIYVDMAQSNTRGGQQMSALKVWASYEYLNLVRPRVRRQAQIHNWIVPNSTSNHDVPSRLMLDPNWLDSSMFDVKFGPNSASVHMHIPKNKYLGQIGLMHKGVCASNALPSNQKSKDNFISLKPQIGLPPLFSLPVIFSHQLSKTWQLKNKEPTETSLTRVRLTRRPCELRGRPIFQSGGGTTFASVA